jgi:uncharacterized protein (TIGR00369 family)
MSFSNQISRGLQQLATLPEAQKKQMLNAFVRQQVKFLDTVDVVIEEMTENRCVTSIVNQTKVQNHVGTVHAAAMILLAETATGMALSMNVSDNCFQVAKEMNIKFLKLAKGNLRAEAIITEEQMQLARTTEKGETKITAKVVDEAGNIPLEYEVTWAWVPKQRTKKEIDYKGFLMKQVPDSLAKLSTETIPDWGGMRPQDMVEHLATVVKLSYKAPYSAEKQPTEQQEQYKQYFLYQPNKYPQGIQSPFHKAGMPAWEYADLESAKQGLMAEVEKLYQFFASPDTHSQYYYHTFFGKVNFDEIQRFHYKHIGHHLEQFGLL